jgi:hypothetical protein
MFRCKSSYRTCDFCQLTVSFKCPSARSCQEAGGLVISKARCMDQNECKVRGSSFPEVRVSVKVVHKN